ncbi:MAG: hypothetical protein G8237_08735 [Magnetococcales bacterium]|nr:hypothetical protein [Magnetococcales bacterium]
MSLPLLITQAKAQLSTHFQNAPPGLNPSHPAYTLFFSLSDKKNRATVCHVSGADFASAWKAGVTHCLQLAKRLKLTVHWLRIDWITQVEATTWHGVHQRLAKTKRNYFRYGLALDPGFRLAFLEMELNANAMLYGGDAMDEAHLNTGNFNRYGIHRFGNNYTVDFSPDQPVYLLTTEGYFFSRDQALNGLPGGNTPQWLPFDRLAGGRRQLDPLTPEAVWALIDSSANFLARQVKESGEFIYGHFPCFGRLIPTYNALRHASSVYSMLEGWELTRREPLMTAIQRALHYLTHTLIRPCTLPDGTRAAFVVDLGEQIKLGANAVSILALVKYQELTGDLQYLPMMEQLALGIAHMQDPVTGRFVHVLHAADLSVHSQFRIIYYDGEAAFGLMRLYGLTRDPRWLAIVQKAFDYFLQVDHWKAHDHWLSYCSNELVRHLPEERYFRFGVQNIVGHLDFILHRETTYPTLLELSMAFEQMLVRLEEFPDHKQVLQGLSLKKFFRAMHHRAHYLLNGFFWPEVAMYFAKPSRVVGSFFIRHHVFRVRIDDIEHYLSGYVAYWKYLTKERRLESTLDDQPEVELLETATNVLLGPVALLRYPEKPYPEMTLLAQACLAKGMAVCYLSLNNFRMQQDGLLHGYRYDSGKWHQESFPIPVLIDNPSPRDDNDRAITSQLEKSATLLFHRLGGKKKILPILARDLRTQQWVIPSQPLSIQALRVELAAMGCAIIKPFAANRGRNVFLITVLSEGQFTVATNESTTSVDEAGLDAFIADQPAGSYMLQRYVASVDAEGYPFDIRVPVFRGRAGAWAIPKSYVRSGTGRVTSNLATGGSTHDVVPFLARLYPEPVAREIAIQLEAAALTVAEVLQAHYDFVIDAIGCDFAVTNGQLYLFEVNDYPGIKGCLEPAVAVRTDYYRHCLEQLALPDQADQTDQADLEDD